MLPSPIVGSAVDGCELPVGPPVGLQDVVCGHMLTVNVA